VLEIPYLEDFDEANHGWLIKGSVDGFRWGDSESLGLITENETRFLGTNSVEAGHNTHTLDYAISPRFNLQGQESVILEFDYSLKVWQRFDKLSIVYRRQLSDSWVPFFDLPKSGIGRKYLWRHWEIEIPAEAYVSRAQIAFKYTDSNEFAYGCAIDNVTLKANTTGIQSLNDKRDLLIYPNPSSGKYRLEFNGFTDDEIRLEVFSIVGSKVLSKTIRGTSGKSIEIDLSEQADGIFYLMVEDSENITWKKLVKADR